MLLKMYMCMCICILCVCLLELDLQMVIGWYLGAGNQMCCPLKRTSVLVTEPSFLPSSNSTFFFKDLIPISDWFLILIVQLFHRHRLFFFQQLILSILLEPFYLQHITSLFIQGSFAFMALYGNDTVLWYIARLQVAKSVSKARSHTLDDFMKPYAYSLLT